MSGLGFRPKSNVYLSNCTVSRERERERERERDLAVRSDQIRMKSVFSRVFGQAIDRSRPAKIQADDKAHLQSLEGAHCDNARNEDHVASHFPMSDAHPFGIPFGIDRSKRAKSRRGSLGALDAHRVRHSGATMSPRAFFMRLPRYLE